MAIFTKSKLLFLFFLVLSLVLAAQCEDQNRDPMRELESCLSQCEVQGKRPEQLLDCQKSCALRYERQQKEKSEGEMVEDMLTQHRDPRERLRECQQRCDRQQQGQQKHLCKQRCEQQYQKEQEQQHGRGETEPDNQGKGGPEKKLKKCQKKCQKQEQGPQQTQCQQRCQQEYQREKEQQPPGQETRGEETNQQQQEENNPYLFQSQRFKSRFRATHGDFRMLQKFTQRSQLLRGIEKFRVSVIELEPQSFVLPHHCDGEAIFVVARGKGTIGIAEQDDKNSFNLESGDVLRLNVGSTMYLLNRDNNEKFFVYVLAKSVNAPGRLQEYFGAGGENQESFYRAFSSDILETAFNTPRDKLERLFGQQKGIIVKASEEQIRALSAQASRSTKQTRGKTQGPFNLLRERPLFESRFGQFIEASPERFEQLRDLDTAVGFMNINQGGMVLPYYNSRSTRVVMAVEGNARFEMACPHLGTQGRGQGSRGEGREQEREQEQEQEEQEQEEGEVRYQKVRGNLNVGDVLVVPAGHPITFIATGGSNVRLFGFGINAYNNSKNFLAGKQNIWRNIDREAKELSFNMPGREVEEILQKQDESYFVAGPEQRERGEEGRRGHEEQYLSSILDFVF